MKIHEEKSNKKLYIHMGIVLIVCIFHLGRFGVRSLNEKSWFYDLFVEITGPVSNVLSSTQLSFVDFKRNYFDLVGVKETNLQLTQKVSRLELKVFELSSLEQENERLKNLLNFTKEIERKKVLARVISWDSANRYQKLRINKGLNHGIIKDSVVISSEGLIGKVVNTSANYSDISTILDFQNKVDVMFDKTRSHGVLEGISDDLTSIKYVKNSDDVQQDETVMTSGLGNIYPKGIKIGVVSSIILEDHALTKEVSSKPFVNFSRLEEVIVLLKEKDIE